MMENEIYNPHMMWGALRDLIQAVDNFFNRNGSLVGLKGRDEFLKDVLKARQVLHKTHDLGHAKPPE